MRSPVSIISPTSVTATGGSVDLRIGFFTRFVTFLAFFINTAGTLPTFAAKLQGSGPAVKGYANTLTGTTVNKLNAGASTTVKLGAQFTQVGNKSISAINLRLAKIGTIAAGKKVTVGIYSDSAGDPDALLASVVLDIDTLITSAYLWVTANLATPLDVADGSVYHVVLSADYTASSANCVVWRSATVASGGNFESFNATVWADTATESLEVVAMVRTFTDITGGAFTGATTGASRQTLSLPATALPEYVRLYGTVGGTDAPAYTVALEAITESQQA